MRLGASIAGPRPPCTLARPGGLGAVPACCLALPLLLFAASSPAEEFRRFALVAGNNDGGNGTRPLRYAAEDAARVHEILTRLGGVRPQDAVLALQRSAEDLRRSFDALESKIAVAAGQGDKPLLVVYYSGHAKDGSLRMGSTALPFEEVKARMSRSAAEVRIGLFDACRSGAMTRTKGARRAPAFDVDTSALRTARGLVMLTSSAADEESQESDELSGSFFSHHLASGLMGAADASGDGRVSLAEAYAYAYERTVADTADTAAGTQHPTFSYDLAGNGDVVLTDVAVRREGVVIPPAAPPGNYFLVSPKGTVVAEVAKVEGTERRVALAPGTYRVKRRLADRLRVGDVVVRPGETAVLDEASLRDVPFTDDPVKGVTRRWAPEAHWSLGFAGTVQGFVNGGLFPATGLLSAELVLHDWLRHGVVLGADLALGGTKSVLLLEGASFPYAFTELGIGVSVLKVWGEGTWTPFAGVRVGLILMFRKFDDPTLPQQAFYAMTPGLVAGLRWRLGRRWSVTGRGRFHYVFYNIDKPTSLGYAEGAAVVSYEF